MMIMRPIIKDIKRLKKIKQNKIALVKESLKMMISSNYSDNSRAITKRKVKTKLLRETIQKMAQTARITPIVIIHITTLTEKITLITIIARLEINQIVTKKEIVMEEYFLLPIHNLMKLLTIRIIIFLHNLPKKFKNKKLKIFKELLRKN